MGCFKPMHIMCALISKQIRVQINNWWLQAYAHSVRTHFQSNDKHKKPNATSQRPHILIPSKKLLIPLHGRTLQCNKISIQMYCGSSSGVAHPHSYAPRLESYDGDLPITTHIEKDNYSEVLPIPKQIKVSRERLI